MFKSTSSHGEDWFVKILMRRRESLDFGFWFLPKGGMSMVNKDVILKWNCGNSMIKVPKSFDAYLDENMSDAVGRLIDLDRELDGALLVLRETTIVDCCLGDTIETIGYWQKSGDINTAREADGLLRKFMKPTLVPFDKGSDEWEFVDLYLEIAYIQGEDDRLLIELRAGDGRVINESSTKRVEIIEIPSSLPRIEGLASWDDDIDAELVDVAVVADNEFNDLNALPVGYIVDYSSEGRVV